MLSVLSLELASCQESRTVKVTVTEEDGTPIENVDTLVTFLGYTGEQTERVKGKTDAKGVFVAIGRPPLRMGVVLEKKVIILPYLGGSAALRIMMCISLCVEL